MTRMERLRREARERAARLGHRLERFRPVVITADPPAPGRRPAVVAASTVCGAMALVDPDPQPGGEALSGEGVTRPCTAIEQEGHEMA